jgi:hypothetical protein
MSTNKPNATRGNHANKKKADKKKSLKERKLNEQQELFCYYYIIEDKSQYESYCLAYPNNKDKPRSQVEANACKLASKPHIQAECDRLLRELQAGFELNEKMIVKGIMDIAFNSVSDSTRLKALDKLAKIQGMYDNETTITHQVIRIDVVDDSPKMLGQEPPALEILPTAYVEIVDEDEEEGEDE